MPPETTEAANDGVEVLPAVPARAPRNPPPPTRIPAAEPRETEAHFLFEELLEKRNGNADGLMSHVTRTEPPPAVQLGGFACGGIRDAAEFYDYIATYFHQAARGPANYQIQFREKGGAFKRTGYIRMPAPGDVVLMGQPRAYGAPGAMNGSPYAQPGFGAAPSQRWDVPTHLSPPQLPPAPPPQAQAPVGFAGHDGGVAELRQQVGFLSGQLAEVVAALRAGHVPPAVAPSPAVGVAAPPPAPATPVVTGVDDFIEKLAIRLGAKPLVGIGAAPAPVPTSTAIVASAPANPLAELATMMQTTLATVKTLRNFGVQMDEMVGLGGATEETDPQRPNLPIVEEPSANDGLPFNVIPIQGIKLAGHDVSYARDKQTGKLSLEGAFFSNPPVMEKLMTLGEVLVRAAVKVAGMEAPAAPVVQGAPQLPAQPTPAAPAAPAATGWPSM